MSYTIPSPVVKKIEKDDELTVCYVKAISQTTGLWRAENALITSLPNFFLQLTVIISLMRLLIPLCKRLHQPRIVAQILAGLMLGPTLLGRLKPINNGMYPFSSMIILETVANLGLIFYIFLVGLESDLKPLITAGKKPYSIAISGIVLSSLCAYGFYNLIPLVPDNSLDQNKIDNHLKKNPQGAFFWVIAMSCSNFPDMAKILVNLKLLRSEMGQMALTSALICDYFSWILILIGLATLHKGTWPALGCTAAFVILGFVAIKPALKWVFKRTAPDDNYSNTHIHCVMFGVVVFGLCADTLGVHAMTGAFLLGVILPKGELKETLMEKLEDFVTGILLPLFFIVMGLRCNADYTGILDNGITVRASVIFVIIFAGAPKILSTLAVALANGMPFTDSLSLGLLMNTKGLMAFIALTCSRDLKALNRQMYSIMFLACWIMTLEIGPLIAYLQKDRKSTLRVKQRSIQNSKVEGEFRVLACITNSRNVHGIINFVRASIPTRMSPICVFAAQLRELAGRATTNTMLILHNDKPKDSAFYDSQGKKKNNINSNNLEDALESLTNTRGEAIYIHKVTVISPYSTMHEDICSLADEKRTTLIVIPMIKHVKDITGDGVGTSAAAAAATIAASDTESINPMTRNVYKNVLEKAPCSVGIFVDRMGTRKDYEGGAARIQHMGVFFIGGPDDREALAYGKRVAGRSSTTLTVVRFIPGNDAPSMDSINEDDGNGDGFQSKAAAALEHNRIIDNGYLAHFRLQTAESRNVCYVEKVVNSTEDILDFISTLEHDFDMFVLGRGHNCFCPLTEGLKEWMDYPEFGPLGDALVSSSFTSKISILILQQHSGRKEEEDIGKEYAGRLKEEFGHVTYHAPVTQPVADFEPFVHRRGRAATDLY